jgi:beta-lactamase regulating signal transducer with metallopeptidase domain
MMWLLVQHFAICAVLALAVAFVCRVGRLRPAVAHLLWLVVLIRLVVPPVVAWPWSAPDIDLARKIMPETQMADGEAISYREAWEGVTLTPATPVSPGDDFVSPNPGGVTNWPLVGQAVLTLWLVGALFLAMIQTLRLRRFNRVLRGQHNAPDWLASEATTLADRFGLPAPRLRVVEGIESPLFYGWRRPAILIPAALIDVIPRDRWQGVMAHELAHWKRRDHWVRGLELVAGCAWWWNPVFWFARHHLRHTAELACDAWVVWTLPESRKTYAKTLVDISEMIALGNRPVAALGIGHGSRRSFERRLSMVMRANGRANVSIVGLVCGLLVLALTVPVFVGAESEKPSEPAPTAGSVPPAEAAPETPQVSDKVNQALDAEISIEFEDEHVARILGFIAEYAGTNFVVDYRVVQPPKPSLGGPAGAPVTAPAPEVAPEELGYITDGMVPRIKLEKVPLHQALNALCTLLDLAYEVRPEYIWISTQEIIDQTDFTDPPSTADASIAEKLKQPIAIEFDSEHIARILDFIGEYVDVNIVIDKDAVPPPVPARPGATVTGAPGSPAPGFAVPGGPTPGQASATTGNAPMENPHKVMTPDGYEMTGNVPYIRLHGVSLNETLKGLFLPLNLTYRVEPGWIYVTRPSGT